MTEKLILAERSLIIAYDVGRAIFKAVDVPAAAAAYARQISESA